MSKNPELSAKTVVIVGAGFGGLQCAKELAKAKCDVILIDKNNHHLFQPLLYQVATAALSPADIAAPVRTIFRDQDNIRIVMDEVVSLDCAQRKIFCQLEGEIKFDVLVLAPGTRHSYFSHPDWEAVAPGLKTLDDALDMRARILLAYENAEHKARKDDARAATTFVVVGGGPTGVELAGALAEIGRHTMIRDFPRLSVNDIRVILVEAGERILPSFDPKLSVKAQKALERLGVEVHCNSRVEQITEDHVQINGESLATETVLWAAGNQAPKWLRDSGLPCDSVGRVIVQSDCSVEGLPNVFVIGDAAHHQNEKGVLLPGVAQPAMQQGRYVAKLIASEAIGRPHLAFHYNDKGNMATIGRAQAVAELAGGIKLWGWVAWLLWAGIHVVSLIRFRNRFRVMMEWLWYYISYQPGARLIVADEHHEAREAAAKKQSTK